MDIPRPPWRDFARRILRPRVEEALRATGAGARSLADGPARIEESLDGLENRALDLSGRLAAWSFSPTMTVAEAWARHPGVQAVFERFHLLRCESCPLAQDESLEDVALSQGFPLSELLSGLEAIHHPPEIP